MTAYQTTKSSKDKRSGILVRPSRYALHHRKTSVLLLFLFLLQMVAGTSAYAQNRPRAAARRIHRQRPDTTVIAQPQRGDTLSLAIHVDSLTATDSLAVADSLAAENKRKMMEMTANPDIKEEPIPIDTLQRAVNRKTFVPNPTKATWLALVIPGGGQIYNRKYWKLPIFYGGFAGCAYALSWNNKMYKDYSAAYKDAVNGNFSSSSITELLPPGYRYSESQLTETLRKRKDTYRRYRDMSIFAFIAVYLLSVVDAYVDAELSNFDISPDLSMSVEPAVIDNKGSGFSCSQKSYGVQCSFRF